MCDCWFEESVELTINDANWMHSERCVVRYVQYGNQIRSVDNSLIHDPHRIIAFLHRFNVKPRLVINIEGFTAACGNSKNLPVANNDEAAELTAEEQPEENDNEGRIDFSFKVDASHLVDEQGYLGFWPQYPFSSKDVEATISQFAFDALSRTLTLRKVTTWNRESLSNVLKRLARSIGYQGEIRVQLEHEQDIVSLENENNSTWNRFVTRLKICIDVLRGRDPPERDLRMYSWFRMLRSEDEFANDLLPQLAASLPFR